MILNIATKDRREHIDLWLTLFQGGSGLTDREKSVLTEVILRRDALLLEGIKGTFLNKLLFDADSRKIYCDTLNITAYNLTNIISAFKRKDIIFEAEGGYELNFTMIPEKELIFKFT